MLNKKEMIDAATRILEGVQAEFAFVDVREEKNDNLEIYHTRIEAKIQRTEKQRLLDAFGLMEADTDELNKFVISVASPDEMGLQDITIHIGKIKAT